MADRRQFILDLLFRGKDKSKAAFKSVSSGFDKLKKQATSLTGVLGTLASGAFFASAVDSAADFETALLKTRAALRATPEEFAAIKEAAAEAGRTTAFTAAQATQAIENLGRSGKTTSEAIQLLPGVLALAVAETLELAEAARFVTSTQAQFQLSISETGRVIDVLVGASQRGDTDVRLLAQALSFVGVLANDAGNSLELTAAAVATLSDNSIRGERAGTGLRAILAALKDPTSAARIELKKLGDESGDFLTAIQTLEKAGKKGEAALLAFGLNAGPSIRVLVNNGSADLIALGKELQNVEGAAQTAADIVGSGFTGATNRLSSAWEALKNSFAEPFLPVVTDAVNLLSTGIGNLAVITQASFAAIDNFFTKVVQGAFGFAAALNSVDTSRLQEELRRLESAYEKASAAGDERAVLLKARIEEIRQSIDAEKRDTQSLADTATALGEDAQAAYDRWEKAVDKLTGSTTAAAAGQQKLDKAAKDTAASGQKLATINGQIVSTEKQKQAEFGTTAQRLAELKRLLDDNVISQAAYDQIISDIAASQQQLNTASDQAADSVDNVADSLNNQAVAAGNVAAASNQAAAATGNVNTQQKSVSQSIKGTIVVLGAIVKNWGEWSDELKEWARTIFNIGGLIPTSLLGAWFDRLEQGREIVKDQIAALADWREQLSGAAVENLPALIRGAERARFSLFALNEARLDELNASIAEAQQRLLDFADQLEQELLQANASAEELEIIRFEQELEKIRALRSIDRARALRLEKEARERHETELNRIRERAAAQAESDQQPSGGSGTGGGAANTGASPGGGTVVIASGGGGAGSGQGGDSGAVAGLDNVLSFASASERAAAIETQRTINQLREQDRQRELDTQRALLQNQEQTINTLENRIRNATSGGNSGLQQLIGELAYAELGRQNRLHGGGL